MTGIAGVGGTADGEGIHVINDHSKYKEWEFIYDIKDDKTAVGAGAVMQNQQLQQQQQAQPQTGFGSNPSPQPAQAPPAIPQTQP